MKILVLTWEFPPRIVGGIARHVAELYPELHKFNHEIHLLTVQSGDLLGYEVVEGIHIHRITVGESKSFFHWIGQMNERMGSYGGDLIQVQGAESVQFDLIHAHDWLVGDAAIALKYRFKIPLISTIHATEYGRNNGIHTDIQCHVHYQENRLSHESWRVIVCSQYMKREVHHSLHTPEDKIDVIYNGIRPEKKRLSPGFDLQHFRNQFALDDEKIVYYVGRITYEKGIRNLLEAAPQVIWTMGGKVKFVIIGGGNTESLQRLTWDLEIQQSCLFTGFMPDSDLDLFQAIASCAVFPSLYEPFGIVALESFAARVPVVVSNTGGMPEVVKHGQTGMIAEVNNSDSIASSILEILKDPDYASRLVENAYQDLLKRFSWVQLARQTEQVYQQVAEERSHTDW